MPRRPPRTDEGQIPERFDALVRRTDLLEQPDAGQIGRRLQSLATLIANLATSIVTGTVNATGDIIAAGNGTIAGAFRNPPAPTTTISGLRVGGWWQISDGLAGIAPSSESVKMNRRLAEHDPEKVLQFAIEYWEYIEQVRMRDDPTFDAYVGPHHHVGTNMGIMAEQAHALGFWEIVIYRRDVDGNLELSDDGEPVPFAVHDVLFAYLLLAPLKSLWGRAANADARSHALAARLAALDGLTEDGI